MQVPSFRKQCLPLSSECAFLQLGCVSALATCSYWNVLFAPTEGVPLKEASTMELRWSFWSWKSRFAFWISQIDDRGSRGTVSKTFFGWIHQLLSLWESADYG